MAPSRSREVWVWRVLLCLWAAQMSWMSSEQFSSDHTRSILQRVLDWIEWSLDPQVLRRVNLILRKLSHVAEYAVLSFLAFRAWNPEPATAARRRAALAILALTVAFAALDEWRQASVRGRTASPADFLLDAAGAAGALALLLHRHAGTQGPAEPQRG